MNQFCALLLCAHLHAFLVAYFLFFLASQEFCSDVLPSFKQCVPREMGLVLNEELLNVKN